ncbi:hypothetical protein RHMOL_Rhmol12G0233400 [Rhododendron molle]|uniref:Uncharacterized protein n=1 Tax=Rhododendron molle TaxID=49168 RepID=A0ACC0LLN5_RHOML|nr:hypothetical protein RHMOL_Rhmol12G0233400 [Rhododendron molle]
MSSSSTSRSNPDEYNVLCGCGVRAPLRTTLSEDNVDRRALEACELTYHIEQNRRPPGLSLQHLVNQILEKYLSECRGKTNLDILSCQAHTALKDIKKYGVCTKSALKFKWCKNKKKSKKTGTWMRIRDFRKFNFNERTADYILQLINDHPIVGEMLWHPSFVGH